MRTDHNWSLPTRYWPLTEANHSLLFGCGQSGPKFAGYGAKSVVIGQFLRRGCFSCVRRHAFLHFDFPLPSFSGSYLRVFRYKWISGVKLSPFSPGIMTDFCSNGCRARNGRRLKHNLERCPIRAAARLKAALAAGVPVPATASGACVSCSLLTVKLKFHKVRQP